MKKSILVFLLLTSGGLLMAQKPGIAIKPSVKCGVPVTKYLVRGIDTSVSRGVADNYYLWDNQATIVVKFMPGGSQRMRDLVMQYAREWEQYANIKFSFVADNTPKTNIRVQLGNGHGHNSTLGTQCNMEPQTVETLNLDTSDFVDFPYYVAEAKTAGVDFSKMTEDAFNAWWDGVLQKPNLRLNNKGMRGTTLHEFGHALGLLHEQSYPGGVKWNKSEDVYAYYKKTQGWDKDKVNAQVFEVSDVFYTNGTTYDPKSIMQYPIEAWQTTDGFVVPRNDDLSAGDKTLIAALYPKDKAVSDKEVPRVSVTNLTAIDVYSNNVKNGISIYPTFDIKSNSKVCQVYFVARLFDESGRFLPDNNDKYNWGGYVATYVKGTLTPNANVSFNKGGKKDLELFLPYSEIPDLQGKKVSIAFTVVLDDVVNGQLDKLIYFSTTTPLSIPKAK
jgi:Astacin (Peptidase family M12A)